MHRKSFVRSKGASLLKQISDRFSGVFIAAELMRKHQRIGR